MDFRLIVSSSYLPLLRHYSVVWCCNGIMGIGLGDFWLPAVALSVSDTASCSHARAFIVTQYNLVPALMPYGWEGNRRSGVALAERHRLNWFIYPRTQCPRKGDE